MNGMKSHQRISIPTQAYLIGRGYTESNTFGLPRLIRPLFWRKRAAAHYERLSTPIRPPDRVSAMSATPTLSEAIEEFLLARRADGLAHSTLSWYASMLSTFHEYTGEMNIAAVSTSALRKYIVALRESDYAPDSIYAYIKALHALFRWAADEYGIPNPMRHVAYPKQPHARMPRRAEDADIIKMLAVCGDDPAGRRDRAIIGFLTDTGCRAGGLVGLTMERLELQDRRAFVLEKGERLRPVFYSAESARFLSEWIALRPADAPPQVFYNVRTKRALTPNGLLEVLRRLGRTAGVTGPVNPHAFRHRFGVNFMLAGGDSGVLQQMLGHSDVETTISRYGQFGNQELAAAHKHRVKSLFKKG